MGKTKLTKCTITKKELGKLDELQRKRFLMITFIRRDLNILNKCLISVTNNNVSEEPYLAAKSVHQLFFIKLLISKIHEMWRFINDNQILQEKDNYSSGTKEVLRKLEIFFADDKNYRIFDFIRNKFGFHYEYRDDVNTSIDTAFDSFDPYDLWLSSESPANEIYLSSNEVFFRVIVNEMQRLSFEGSDQDKLEYLIDAIRGTSNLFAEFSLHYLVDELNIDVETGDEIEVMAPSISDILLSLIVSEPKGA